ncbi:MAG TPA: PqqD family protein [Gemmatimonadales bacterium]|nr:PqqD family protein [Gemmatimonadales bacterium]
MPDDPAATISDGVMVAHLEGEAILLDLDGKRYYRLNVTAQRVWKGLEDRRSVEEIVGLLVAEFEVDRATAAAETTRILEDLRTRGLVA